MHSNVILREKLSLLKKRGDAFSCCVYHLQQQSRATDIKADDITSVSMVSYSERAKWIPIIIFHPRTIAKSRYWI